MSYCEYSDLLIMPGHIVAYNPGLAALTFFLSLSQFTFKDLLVGDKVNSFTGICKRCRDYLRRIKRYLNVNTATLHDYNERCFLIFLWL